eukprot:TRINITY_DN24151_c0_g1_i1.p1 TRINITY_DN24151_c0_g1~~TRINITY_DN24151_c0_g1_i1.p1  ORF type:complete len:163 (-),score=27.36 TRINITY_DN24151_c0_g1_i1:3-491(-)
MTRLLAAALLLAAPQGALCRPTSGASVDDAGATSSLEVVAKDSAAHLLRRESVADSALPSSDAEWEPAVTEELLQNFERQGLAGNLSRLVPWRPKGSQCIPLGGDCKPGGSCAPDNQDDGCCRYRYPDPELPPGPKCYRQSKDVWRCGAACGGDWACDTPCA